MFPGRSIKNLKVNPKARGRLKAGLEDVGVPAEFAGNVTESNVAEVRRGALQRQAKYERLGQQFNRSTDKQRNDIVQEVTDDIVRMAIEIDPSKPGAEPAIIADIASGLAALKEQSPQLLSMAFRRASNASKPSLDAEVGAIGAEAMESMGNTTNAGVELLRSLVEVDLDSIPEPKTKSEKRTRRKEREQAVAEEDKFADKPFSEEDLPVEQRLSENPLPPKPGKTLADAKKNRTGKPTLFTMAGDQIKEIHGIENEEILNPVTGKSYSPKIFMDTGKTATLPPVQGYANDIDAVMNVGTGMGGRALQKRSGSQLQDTAVDQRNRSFAERLREETFKAIARPEMFPNTQLDAVKEQNPELAKPVPDQPAYTDGLQFLPMQADLSTWLDTHLPEWRARFAERGEGGTLAYPNPPKAPSADFVTGLLMDKAEISPRPTPGQPDVRGQIREFVDRAIAAAPAEPPDIKRVGRRATPVQQAAKPRIQGQTLSDMANPTSPYEGSTRELVGPEVSYADTGYKTPQEMEGLAAKLSSGMDIEAPSSTEMTAQDAADAIFGRKKPAETEPKMTAQDAADAIFGRKKPAPEQPAQQDILADDIMGDINNLLKNKTSPGSEDVSSINRQTPVSLKNLIS